MSSQNYVSVAIHGVPRSGTSWIGEIVNSSPNTIYRYQPLFSYAHKDALSEKSDREEIDRFFVSIRNCEDAFTNQTEKRENGQFPNFQKDRITHVAYKEVRYMNLLPNLMAKADKMLLCAVIRNPLSVIYSWLNAPREFRRDLGWNEREEWRFAERKNLNRPEEFNGYEKWKESALMFFELQNIYPDRVCMIKYDEILANPLAETEKVFSFLNLPVTDQTVDFLRESGQKSNANAYAVYRSNQRDDKWKDGLNSQIANAILEDISTMPIMQHYLR